MSLLRDPTVLRKLDVSWVLADSPRTRERGPKATRELHENTFGQLQAVDVGAFALSLCAATYGV